MVDADGAVKMTLRDVWRQVLAPEFTGDRTGKGTLTAKCRYGRSRTALGHGDAEVLAAWIAPYAAAVVIYKYQRVGVRALTMQVPILNKWQTYPSFDEASIENAIAFIKAHGVAVPNEQEILEDSVDYGKLIYDGFIGTIELGARRDKAPSSWVWAENFSRWNSYKVRLYLKGRDIVVRQEREHNGNKIWATVGGSDKKHLFERMLNAVEKSEVAKRKSEVLAIAQAQEAQKQKEAASKGEQYWAMGDYEVTQLSVPLPADVRKKLERIVLVAKL